MSSSATTSSCVVHMCGDKVCVCVSVYLHFFFAFFRMHDRFEAGLTDNQVQKRKSANYKEIECKKPWERQFVQWTSKEQLGIQHTYIQKYLSTNVHIGMYLFIHLLFIFYLYSDACIYLCL